MASPRSRRRLALLATVCLAVFAINLDTTIVNVALPELARQLGATTRDLQWIVDGYNLAFAALVLTAGSIGDRFGRRPVLIGGLAGFAVASAVGAVCTGAGALVAVRFVMGAFAALIYPTTLSVITNAYPDRAERAKAIGVWGAVTGLGVAVGPVTGGLLLAHFWWGGVFLALVPVALAAAALAVVLVPESSDPGAARLDLPGLVTSSAGIGLLVYTIIEAPHRGWTSFWTIAGFTATAIIVALFITVERRRANPMLDVSLFRTPAFSAASGAVTVAFFALFGFIFLITQYFQFIRGYGTVSTGVRILPVALTIAAGSVLGAWLAGRLGTRVIVVTGLTLFGTAFAWIAVSATYESYLRIAAQMLIMGAGLGLTTAPATESILSVLPAAKAGIGSAVNDATREAGGTLGVAVIGSVFTSIYVHQLAGTSVAALPAQVAGAARDSVGAAIATATHAAPAVSQQLVADVNASFMSGLHIACLVAAGVCWLGALGGLALPGRRDMGVPRPGRTVSSDAEPALAG
ncbi:MULTISPECIES: MFS transporter [unclassified Frankia]|uniref:MFS transporter n=1 Tax=unclassified Frankia TaxID=2632575 RepID=UPI001EF45362|nr:MULTISPECIES: MFS transporter [unclassified Frankia]